MKHLLKYLLAAAVLPLWGQAAAAGPFGQLRGLCEPGKSVLLTAPTVVEGIVVSDYRSPNMELNPNLNYYPVAVEFRPVDRSPASDVVERLDPDPAVGIKLYLGGSARRRNEKFVLGGREFAHADGFGVIDRAADGRQGRQAAHRAVA